MRPDPVAPSRAAVSALARSSSSGLISVAVAAKALGVTPARASGLLTRLTRSGWLTRLRRGVYYVLPLDSESAASTTHHDPWLVAIHLFGPCYIGGWSAAEHWALTEQLFAKTFVVTSANIRLREQAVLGLKFVLRKVPSNRVRGVPTVWRGSERVSVSSRERTLVDALRDPSWLGGIRNVADALSTYLEDPHSTATALLREMRSSGSGAAAKRLGFLLETLEFPAGTEIETLLALRPAGNIKLDPAIPSRGRLSKRWGLWINANVQLR